MINKKSENTSEEEKDVKPNLSTDKVKLDDRKELQGVLIALTNEKITEKFSNKNLDRHNEIIELRSGRKICLSDFVLNAPDDYWTMFYTEFYAQIWRLNGWPVKDKKFRDKPHSVAMFTLEVIYGRFYKEVLPALRQNNPFIGYYRSKKLFQFLTMEAKIQLLKYIDQATDLMKECETMHEFKKRYRTSYGEAFQTSLFEDN